jgi:SHS2 domain-containing protein
VRESIHGGGGPGVMGYRIVDHTADLGIDVRAGSLDALFAESARGFVDCITEVDGVIPRRQRLLRVASDSLESLLVDWLSELLFVFETSGELFSEVDAKVTEAATDWKVVARLGGERFDSDRHPLKVPIKAVTYHGLEVDREESGSWRARVI